MEIGKEYEVNFKGFCVKKELYKDGKVRAWIQNNESNEMAVVIENEVKGVTLDGGKN